MAALTAGFIESLNVSRRLARANGAKRGAGARFALSPPLLQEMVGFCSASAKKKRGGRGEIPPPVAPFDIYHIMSTCCAMISAYRAGSARGLCRRGDD
ncbi:hypothetical protein CQW49_18410 [Methylosinus trichosporium OB3b]|uniref:Uncharacterized protein n=1 Tax=Methylosinus trichosporium (strain ATCC 35070 / NCIMB 11131 / UNIQEM 75 / OB3b) TaxID=595536 RepID=A0A2D2D3R0_METT3|nr:hypothetical protein CQW49_18410 [Methylosinus trichosporium OB3b]OBS53029.1 hypothetical protein A8B73_08075 [Methylosinus sp. 3S-1]